MRQKEILLQTCRIPVCHRNSLRQICGRMKFCCRLAAYQYATGTVCGRSAAGWNFAPDLPHTSMPQEQSAADLRQDETLLQTCRILVCHRNSLRQICGRMKFCCRLAAYQYATGTVCGRSAAGWNFAPDLPHTSMPQEQSAADLRQDETLLQTCRIPVRHRNSLRQVCHRKVGNYTVWSKAI